MSEAASAQNICFRIVIYDRLKSILTMTEPKSPPSEQLVSYHKKVKSGCSRAASRKRGSIIFCGLQLCKRRPKTRKKKEALRQGE